VATPALRPLHIVAGGLLVGVIIALGHPPAGLPAGTLCWLIGMIALTRLGSSLRRPSPYALLAVCTLTLAAGSGLLRGASIPAAPLAAPLGALTTGSRLGTISGVVDGAVLDVPDPTAGRVLLFPIRTTHSARRALVRIRVPRGQPSPRVEPGDRVRVAGRMRPPSAPGNPGERDRRSASRRSGIVLRVSSTAGAMEVRRPDRSTLRDGVRRAGARFREALTKRLHAALGPRRQVRAVAAALLLGDRSGLPEHVQDDFRGAGAAHLLAVSGLHVVLLIGTLSALLGHVAERVCAGARSRAVALLISLLALAAYAMACRLATPVVRASVFVALAMTARALGRRTTTADHLAAAVLVVIAADPAQALGAGFQLSFAAVAGLCLLTTRFREALFSEWDLLARFPEALPRWNLHARLWLARAVSASLAASTATAPVTAVYFGELHPAAVLANVIAVPIVALLLPLCGLAATIGAPAEPLLGPIVSALCWLLTHAVGVVAALPGATIAPGRASPLLAIGAMAALGIASIPRPWTRRHLAIPLGVWIALAVAPSSAHVALAPGVPALVALDVGHGQAVLILGGRGGTVLADAGGGVRGTADRALLPALRALGVRRLSALALSHEDTDHCGAAPALIAALPIGVVLVPPGFGGDPAGRRVLAACRRRAVPVTYLARGDIWETSDLRLRALQPLPGRPGPADNDGSLVLHVDAGSTQLARRNRITAHLPGDVEGAALEALAADPTVPRADVLLLPHHGRGDPRPQMRLARRCRATHLVASTSIGAPTKVRAALQTGRDGALLFIPRRKPRSLRP